MKYDPILMEQYGCISSREYEDLGRIGVLDVDPGKHTHQPQHAGSGLNLRVERRQKFRLGCLKAAAGCLVAYAGVEGNDRVLDQDIADGLVEYFAMVPPSALVVTGLLLVIRASDEIANTQSGNNYRLYLRQQRERANTMAVTGEPAEPAKTTKSSQPATSQPQQLTVSDAIVSGLV